MTDIEATQKVYEIILAQYGNQYKAAKHLGKTQSFLHQIVNRPSYNSAFKLADLFNVPYTIIIGE